jgi:large subunit ribosomal protein L20
MARVKRGVMVRKRHNKLLAQAKGFRGNRSRNYKVAHEAVMRALSYAYVHRRTKKRDMRRLWIVRINAAARLSGLSYSQFMAGLHSAGIELNRKMLAELAVREPAEFARIARLAKDAVAAKA